MIEALVMLTVHADEGFAKYRADDRPHKAGPILTKMETESAGSF